MALEQVVPVVPQGTFSVTTRKASRALPFLPQWSCGDKEDPAHLPERRLGQGSDAGPQEGWGARGPLTWTSVYSQSPLKL